MVKQHTTKAGGVNETSLYVMYNGEAGWVRWSGSVRRTEKRGVCWFPESPEALHLNAYLAQCGVEKWVLIVRADMPNGALAFPVHAEILWLEDGTTWTEARREADSRVAALVLRLGLAGVGAGGGLAWGQEVAA